MKRSRSGTQPPADQPGLPTYLIIAALAIVIAFAGSMIFGLRGRNTAPTTEPGEATPQSAVAHDARAKVEVFNGSGRSGLAKLATEQLRDGGYDVVQFGNAAQITPTSYVIDRIGKHDVAAAVGQQIGITSVRTKIDTTRLVDASVMLGKDWPPKKQAPVQRKKTWKDKLLRR